MVRAMSETEQKQWHFYLARCSDGSLYSGIAVDPVKRMEVHNAGKGARYTRSRLPVEMVYSETLPDQSSALKREAEVRKWSHRKKEELTVRKANEDF
jgi:predicted GIY-YIG superfamily endonuclease